MNLCLQCGNTIEQPVGKKTKNFCNNTCRSNYWYDKNKKKGVVATAPSKSKILPAKKGIAKEKFVNAPQTPIGSSLPRTLDDIKEMCPKDLTGFDRSVWISKTRVFYKI